MPCRLVARVLVRALAVLTLAAGLAPPATAQSATAAACLPFTGFPLAINLGSGLNVGDGETVRCALGKTMQAINLAAPAAAVGLARSDISGRAVPINVFTVSGFAAVGDAGAGARYKLGTSAGLMAVQDKAGRWFELDLSDGVIRAEWLGVVAGSPAAAIGNALAINTGLAALAARGGGELRLPPGNIYVGLTLDNHYDYVTLSGSGRISVNYGAAVYPTTLVPTFSGTVVRHRSLLPGDHVVQGGGLVDFRVIGNGVALRNVEINTVWGGKYRFWSEQAVGDAGVYIFGAATSGGGSLQKMDLDISSFQYGSGPQANAHAVVIDGDGGANVSLNDVLRLDVAHQNGDGLVLANSDNNRIWLRANRVAGGTGAGLRAKAGASPSLTSSDNFFSFLSTNSPIIVEGTESAAYPADLRIDHADLGNGTPMPTIGTGARAPVVNVTASYTPTLGSVNGSVGAGAVADMRWTQEASGRITATVFVSLPNGSTGDRLTVSLPRPLRNGQLYGTVSGWQGSPSARGVAGLVGDGSKAFITGTDGSAVFPSGTTLYLTVQYVN